MAKPIQTTPVLKGRDAVNFFAKLEENRNKRIDKKELSDIRKNAEKLRSILKSN
ncbi:hypothetical protein [Agriterribacter sp.]|uniref:hypothetical protein n=1 Tax=Agriterribacter sp. TaxID=2821509 RepID=UPI002B93C1C5|nr:hypothetical protein [Agriterribacter sp.]HTN06066.1 hypothetical protein [Agriterribacter sp.]